MFASLVKPDFCHYFYMNRDFTMSLTGVLVILPFCFSKRIDFLRLPRYDVSDVLITFSTDLN